MVAHDVSKDGATTNSTYGRLDTTASGNPMANMTWRERFNISQQYAKEPLLPMWLMYQCPYSPIGKTFNCPARGRQAQENRSTFLANERTLSMVHGSSQVRAFVHSPAGSARDRHFPAPLILVNLHMWISSVATAGPHQQSAEV